MSTGIADPAPPSTSTLLARRGLRAYLEGYVRRRVRPGDVDDTVQAVLCAALEARRIPAEEEELRRWLTGIARRKVATMWARAAREQATDTSEIEGDAPPIEERALASWAEREAAAHGGNAATRTLGWMAREGEGEKLESIAADVNEPAPRVRQRVSRLRRWLRARWSAEIAAAVGAAVAMALLAWFVLGRGARPALHETPRAIVLPDLDPVARGREIRERAIRECDAADYPGCLRHFDDAAQLDPAGDAAPSVVEARARATRAMTPPPPSPSARSLTPAPTFAPSVPPPSPSSMRPSKRPSKTMTTPSGSSG